MKSFPLDGAELVLGGRNLWLLREGERVPAAPLRYHEGRLRDALEVAGTHFDVPRGRGKHLQRFLAEHRLRPLKDALSVVEHVYVESRDELEALALGAWLEEGELVLAYLHTTTDVPVTSELGPTHEVPWRFVWTDRRATLLAVGPLGDLASKDITALAIESRTGRDRVRGSSESGGAEWRTTLRNETAFAAIAPLLSADGRTRLRAVVDASRPAHREAAAQLLAHLRGPRAPVERALLAAEAPRVDDDFVAAMSPEAMVAWAEAWSFGSGSRDALIAALRAHDPTSEHALALAEVTWRRSRDQDPIGADLARATHLREAGLEAAAAEVLERALAALPAPEVAELVPRDDPHAHVAGRIRLLEGLVGLAPDAHLRLARIEPLSAARVALVAGGGRASDAPPEARRAARVLEVLKGEFAMSADVGAAEPIAEAALEALRHPMSTTDRFASTLQGLVATVETPDHDALRRFCAPLARPDAVAAFDHARTRLGVNAVCYVSRGEDATGCRAHHDAQGEFLVLGARHLEDGALNMSAAELRFVFACELAHLRFGHTRVTQSDMWRGALDKGMSGAELVLMALPLVRQIRIPDAVGTMLGVVKDGTVGKLWDKASGLFGKGEKSGDAEETEADAAREAVLATHRLMQLSADRVGLAVVGDPGPALRSMLALRGEADLAGAAERGLAEWVSRRAPGGDLKDPDLAIRATALLSRWLRTSP